MCLTYRWFFICGISMYGVNLDVVALTGILQGVKIKIKIFKIIKPFSFWMELYHVNKIKFQKKRRKNYEEKFI